MKAHRDPVMEIKVADANIVFNDLEGLLENLGKLTCKRK